MRASNVIRIVPGATHLFEEEGGLEEVAVLAREWFEKNHSPAGCVMQISHSPPRRGGVDATSRKYRAASFEGADGVVTRARAPRHPSSARRGMVSSAKTNFHLQPRADSD